MGQSRHRVPKELKGLRQGLKRFEAGENHQGKKAQVDAIDGLAGNERDGKYENSPQRQVHQDIVQRLLQARNERQAPLYLVEFAVESSDFLLLIASAPASQQVLHALDTVHNLRLQFSSQRQLPLAQPTCKRPGQERNAKGGSDKERRRHPGQF